MFLPGGVFCVTIREPHGNRGGAMVLLTYALGNLESV